MMAGVASEAGSVSSHDEGTGATGEKDLATLASVALLDQFAPSEEKLMNYVAHARSDHADEVAAQPRCRDLCIQLLHRKLYANQKALKALSAAEITALAAPRTTGFVGTSQSVLDRLTTPSTAADAALFVCAADPTSVARVLRHRSTSIIDPVAPTRASVLSVELRDGSSSYWPLARLSELGSDVLDWDGAENWSCLYGRDGWVDSEGFPLHRVD
jgi:hypothetical protein